MRVRDLGAGRSLTRPALPDDGDDGDGVGLVDLPFPAGVDLDPLDLADARVVSADATGARGDGEIRRCVLASVDLSQSRFRPLTLADVRLTGGDVSNAQWHAVAARRVEILSVRAVGLGLSVDLAADLYVEQARLDYAGVHLERSRGPVAFVDCSFRDARIGGDLSGVVFADCDFAGAEFAATAARGADLRSSRLAGARGLHTLRGAVIEPDQLIGIAAQLAAEAGLRTEDPDA